MVNNDVTLQYYANHACTGYSANMATGGLMVMYKKIIIKL